MRASAGDFNLDDFGRASGAGLVFAMKDLGEFF